MIEREPLRTVRTHVIDSERWKDYRPRPDDIIIATAPKCGTTWMQRIVGMLVFQSTEPFSIWEASPWPDMRLFEPVEVAMGRAEAQTHRRFIKTHLPYDALPVGKGGKIIHVGRDGRDAALSMHNHQLAFMPEMLAHFDEIIQADPDFATAYHRVPADPAEYFHHWVTDDVYNGEGDAAASFFHVEKSYWAVRDKPDILFVHYADLKRDRAGEMRRVAKFLDIDVAESLWPQLIEAAGFEAMRADGDQLLPMAGRVWDSGSNSFINRGTNGRWRDLFRKEDIELYKRRVSEEFEPELAQWIEHGRLAASVPAD